jgi:hypothetical protein
MAKINLNTEEARDEAKEKVTGIHIDFNAGPPRSIIFYDDIGARYFFLNEEKVRKAVEELVKLIEADGEEF